MKVSFKLFIMTFLIIIISLGLGGFLIINSTFMTELSMKKENTINSNMLLTTIYYSIASRSDISDFYKNNFLLQELQNINDNGEVFIGKADSLKYFNNNSFANNLKENETGSQIIIQNGIIYFQVITKININNEDIYLENLVDVSDIYLFRRNNYHLYSLFLIIISLISSTLIASFSIYITRPLKNLQKSADNISKGNFDERSKTSLKDMKSPELVDLAMSFNYMANTIENHIIELEDYNKRQEDFISRFTHELKTPLTSIIGYADMLRSFSLNPNERYDMANYIYKEGKRLEDLSFHLLELILLKKEEFTLVEVNTQKFFNELKNTLNVLLKKKELKLVMNIENAFINIEPVLLKSLLYNLVDNSCKASNKGSEIIVNGKIIEGHYQISVQDFGTGIPKSSIDKVSTAFYMVDKSRARKQGGAGLGLSLCEEIAKIHKTRLNIESEINKGTKISFEVEVK